MIDATPVSSVADHITVAPVFPTTISPPLGNSTVTLGGVTSLLTLGTRESWMSAVFTLDTRAMSSGAYPGNVGVLSKVVVSVTSVQVSSTRGSDMSTIVLPPELGASWPFRIEEISRYDERGPAWYWNNFSCGEHTGTHFDAPVHWISGKDLPDASVDSIPADAFVRPVCVIDCSQESAADEDFLLTPAFIEAWEEQHGRIPAGSWVLMRTDWSKRSGAEYLNMREDGAHTPGPTGEAIRLLQRSRGHSGGAHDQHVESAEPARFRQRPVADKCRLVAGLPHHLGQHERRYLS